MIPVIVAPATSPAFSGSSFCDATTPSNHPTADATPNATRLVMTAITAGIPRARELASSRLLCQLPNLGA